MDKKNKNLTTAINVIGVIVGMFALTYASAPLYDLFCRITGFGGKTVISTNVPDKIYDREVEVLLNTDVSPNLPWEFKVLQRKVKVKVGENKLIFFEAKNISDKPEIGIASYNVTPEMFGGYFNKVQCFCFERQLINPGQTVTFPVSFFISPEILNNKELDGVNNVTLSYSFMKAE